MEEYTDSEEIDQFRSILTSEGPDSIKHYLDYQKDKNAHCSLTQAFKTGFQKLDALVSGFETGEVTVISGPTGNGKTLFADSIGQRLMRLEKMNIAWFSYEVPTTKMIEKYVNAEDSKELGLYVPMELKTGDIEWIKRKSLEAQLKYQCKAIFIDHIHFLVDMATKQNMSLNIGGVMRQIKHDIAKAMNLMVFIICHQGQPKDDEPSIENIRDSSFIGQESDNVFVVYRLPDPLPEELKKNASIKGYPRTYDEGFAVVKVEKARRAGSYRKKIILRKEGQWLEEYEESL